MNEIRIHQPPPVARSRAGAPRAFRRALAAGSALLALWMGSSVAAGAAGNTDSARASAGAGTPMETPAGPPAAGAVAPPVPRSSVRIVAPKASDVAYGTVTIRAEVIPPTDVKVIRVELFADGVLQARDPFPPYVARWDAGKEMGSHVLRAIARFSDGTSGEDLITTRGLRFMEHELVEGKPIEHVEILASVADRAGAPIAGLSAGDFDVRDGGAPVAITGFKVLGERQDVPLSVTVLVDRSGSMELQMKKWREACLSLLSSLRPIDQVRVSAFSEETVVLQEFTHDAASLAASLNAIGPAVGGTRLFHAIFESVRDMRDLPGRKALILLTDGLDTEFSSVSGPTSAAMFDVLAETVKMASRARVTVILVLPGPTGRGYLAVQDLALQTGGWWLYPSDDLKGLMKRLGERLLSGYLLSYDTERPADSERKRPIQVKLKRDLGEGVEVHASLGAYARLDAIPSLRDDLQSGNAEQRARAATELGEIDDPETGPLLLKALKDDAPEVRASAMMALAERRDAEAMEKVLKHIHDADPGVRAAAFEAAVRYGGSAVPFLLDVASHAGGGRLAALRALGDIGDARGLTALRKGLEDRDCEVRSSAAEGVAAMVLLQREAGEAEAAASLDLLRAHIGDSCETAADGAAIALGRLGDAAALPRLLARCDATPAPPRLAEMIGALGAYPDAGALAAVEARLSAPDPAGPAARAAAAQIYRAAIITGRPIDPLVALTRLESLGGDAAIATLRDLLAHSGREEKNAEWRERLHEALRSLGAE